MSRRSTDELATASLDRLREMIEPQRLRLTRSVESRSLLVESCRALVFAIAMIVAVSTAIVLVSWVRDCVTADARWERQLEEMR